MQLKERAKGCPMGPDPAWHSMITNSRNLRFPRTLQDLFAGDAEIYSDVKESDHPGGISHIRV